MRTPTGVHVLVAILCALLASGLPGAPARAQFVRFQHYGTEQGLGNLAVEAVAQDTDGAMLAGTQGGLFRFDGAAFQPLLDPAIPQTTWVHQILLDHAGRLWLVTGSGIFVRAHDAFTRVAPLDLPEDEIGANSIADTGREVVLLLPGRIVAVADTGAQRPLFDAATLARLPALRTATFVASDGAGGVLVGCGTTVCHADAGGGVTVLGRADGLPADTWEAALGAPDGTLWLRSVHSLAFRPPGARMFSVAAVPDAAPSSFATHPGELTLASAGPGRVYTEADDGLLEWNGHGWRLFPHHAGGLPPNIAHAIFSDREGSLWVGSDGGGLSRSLGLGVWEHWTVEDGLPNGDVWELARAPGGPLWAATDRGTVEIGGRHRVLPGSNYAVALTRGGRLWITASGRRIARLEPGASEAVEIATVPDVTGAKMDSANRLWLATRTGVVAIDDADAPAAAVHPRLVLRGKQFQISVDPRGRIWTEEGARLFRETDDAGLAPVAMPANWSGSITDLTFARDGTLWAGTETEGVAHLRLDGGGLTALPSLTAPVIASNSILSVLSDRVGRLWIGSDHGIDMVNGATTARFDSSDGPISNDLNEGSILEDTDGSLWFGTSSGLSHLIDPKLIGARRRLHPVITAVSYGNRVAHDGQRLEAPWSSAPLVIRVDDFDYATGPLLFRYRLRGVDNRWTESGSREIRYANARPGQLVFEVEAVNAAHGLASLPVTVAITIHPPWWRQWWFFAGLVVAGSGAVTLSWWLRIGYLIRQRAQLEELVRSRTVEIEAANERLARQSAREQRRLEEMVRARTEEIERAREELQRLALSDALTGLPNRRAVLFELESWLTAQDGDTTAIAALLLDIDHFKDVNDRFGHAAGDEVLAQCGARLLAAVAPGGMAGRYGGEEFLVILRGEEEELRERAQRVWAAVSDRSYEFSGQLRSVTASAGVAHLCRGETSMALIGRADAALYRAKQNGRARLEHADGGAAREAEAALPPEPASGVRDRPVAAPTSPDLARELPHALANGQFTLAYQPIVDARRQVVTACEALLRWHSPSAGPVPPAVFIPLAQELGLMPDLGAWVLREACRTASSWPREVGVAVNVSPSQFADASLIDRVSAALAAANLPARRLEVEITEGCMIDDVSKARCVLDRLRDLGVSVALDDFGTGYSSLSFLHALPFDRIKIDRSFVTGLATSPRSVSIVRSLVALSRELDVRITAEGVETEQQRAMLVDAGCTELQGYLLGRPMGAEQMRALLAGARPQREAALTPA